MEGIIAKASVGLANAEDRFTGEDARPLFRGEGVFPKFDGLYDSGPTSGVLGPGRAVFLSSTFTDFSKERDALMRHVLPELQRRCSGQGVSVSLVDLRWGVAESSSRQELASCLREIDAAYPFFVSLIGERYGTRAPQEGLQVLGRETAWLQGVWEAKYYGA